MADQINESFETWSNAADTNNSFVNLYQVIGSNLISATGRFGNGIGSNLNSGPSLLQWFSNNPTPLQSTWIIHHAAKSSSFHIQKVCEVWRGSVLQLGYWIDENGYMYAELGDGSRLATADLPIQQGVWYSFQYKTILHASAGLAACRINGGAYQNRTMFSFTGKTTNGATAATADTIKCWISPVGGGGVGNENLSTWDDLVIRDGSGASNNDWMGDVKCTCRLPISQGNYSQMTRLSGTGNYQMVQEQKPDGLSTYVSDQTVGHRDSYIYPAISDLSQIYGLWIRANLQDDTAGARTVAAFLRQAGVNYDGSGLQPAVGFGSYMWRMDVNPATGTAWNPATDSNEFGLLIAS